MTPDESKAVDEILAQLVWEFTLISNGLQLEQHTKEEAGDLERKELKSAATAIQSLLVRARYDELNEYGSQGMAATAKRMEWLQSQLPHKDEEKV